MNRDDANQLIDAFEIIGKRLREIERQLSAPLSTPPPAPLPPPTTGSMRLLLRPSEVATALSVSRSKVYELMAAGAIPSITIGGVRRVPLDRLREWIASQQ